MKSNIIISSLALAALAFSSQSSIAQSLSDSMHQTDYKSDSAAYVLSRQILFHPGDSGSKFYRIPALASLPGGTLVAVADKRIDSNADLPGRIDIVCRRSSDRGLTWSPATTVIAHDEGGGYGDPALLYDSKTGDVLCIMTHGNGLWQSTRDNHARIMISRSSDKGTSWSHPYDITPMFFSSDSTSTATIKGISSFASSGRALSLKDGRLMFVLVVRDKEKRYTPLLSQVVYSDDGGYKWTAALLPADVEGDESKVAELSDGSIIMSIRNRYGNARKFSRSFDGGLTWTPPFIASSLKEPACNGDIIVASDPDGREILLHSIPFDPQERKNVSLCASTDRGETWQYLIPICPFGSAYSSISLLDDGTLGAFSEEDSNSGGYNLVFTRLDLPKLLKDKLK